MKVRVLEECGREAALLGLSLSRRQSIERMESVAERLASRDGGHNKFLESIVVWLDVTAPRYWWQQFDTYRVGVTKQSESTMYSLTRRPLTPLDFEGTVAIQIIAHLNTLIQDGELEAAKRALPEAFLQRRVVCLNYKVLRHIIAQRKNHRLSEWRFFIREVLGQVRHPEYMEDLMNGRD
jgi:thymidylate synthase ThyX